ncbi:hypothetical protein ACRWWM_25430, partial [Escherichia coli]
QKQKKLIMLPSETMIWQPEFTDKTLSRKTGAVQPSTISRCCVSRSRTLWEHLAVLNMKSQQSLMGFRRNTESVWCESILI